MAFCDAILPFSVITLVALLVLLRIFAISGAYWGARDIFASCSYKTEVIKLDLLMDLSIGTKILNYMKWLEDGCVKTYSSGIILFINLINLFLLRSVTWKWRCLELRQGIAVKHLFLLEFLLDQDLNDKVLRFTVTPRKFILLTLLLIGVKLLCSWIGCTTSYEVTMVLEVVIDDDRRYSRQLFKHQTVASGVLITIWRWVLERRGRTCFNYQVKETKRKLWLMKLYFVSIGTWTPVLAGGIKKNCYRDLCWLELVCLVSWDFPD
jgi:hypothetical protein